MKRLSSLLPGILLLAAGALVAPTLALSQQNPPPPVQPVQDTQKPPDQKAKETEKHEKEPKENEKALEKQQLEGPTAAAAAGKEAAAKKEEKWDVDNPPGPRTEAPLDVTEGTWMSLDVSPDGKEIAFDLLGDLYTVPIAGGEARALTHDVAWQMQPRYSPDGKTIAFTSDQGGGDNIWVMNRDGSNVHAVTKESFRLLNSPAWSPDGEYIVARKHFTAQRSRGAGERSLYHRSGGDGLQLTKKPNAQKHPRQPA